MLAARAASSVSGAETNEVGIRMESMIRAGLTGPIGEALATYYQVLLQSAWCSKPLLRIIAANAVGGWRIVFAFGNEKTPCCT